MKKSELLKILQQWAY